MLGLEEPEREEVKMLSVSQAAKRLGIHPATLRSWESRGLIKAIRLPTGGRRFDPAEVERVRREMGFDKGTSDA